MGEGRNQVPMDPVSRLQPPGARGDLLVRRVLVQGREVEVVLGVVADLVAPVDDPAGQAGVFGEPGADREHRHARPGPFAPGECGAGEVRVAPSVEGEGDAGPVAGTVRDPEGQPGEAVRGGGGGRSRFRQHGGASGSARRPVAPGASRGEGGGQRPGPRAQCVTAAHRSPVSVHARPPHAPRVPPIPGTQ